MMEGSTTATATEEEPAHRIKNRASARNQVAQQWATRRQSASERPSAAAAGNHSNSNDTSGKPPSPPRLQQTQQQQNSPQQPQLPSLCYIIGKAWQEAMEGISKQLPAPLKPHTASSSATTSSSSLSNKANNKKEKGKSHVRSFPSVLQILQANALQQQVEHFQVGQQQHQQPTTQQQDYQDKSLQILPQGYNFHQAIVHMAQSRSRAFLLLDLASIVPTLVNWKQSCKSSSNSSTKIQFLYTVQYNADPKLLQLLLRSNVGLVCTNKWDLQRSRQALQELSVLTSTTSTTASQVLFDNATTTGKPDGYLRHLVLDAQVETVVVDGPEEVIRITQALQRMQQRRQQQKPPLRLDFVLRLSSSLDNTMEWKQLVQKTQQAIAECREQSCISEEASLVGLSADVSHATPEILAQLQELLLQQLTGPVRRLDLTGVSMPPTSDMLDWWQQLSSTTTTTTCAIQITVDVSHALISPAGALCTRIIGVKEEQDETSGLTKRHYYIDDGCYGSLYSPGSSSSSCTSNNIHISNPLPLLYDEEEEEHQQQGEPASTAGTTTTRKEMYTSTVWGPTCDGLDKVSHDILLPKLHRDSWLVFPDLGCRVGEGLGTAFNGFAPPDTAYCVLGYFGK